MLYELLGRVLCTRSDPAAHVRLFLKSLLRCNRGVMA
jgi:hypothetical protein